jgi:GDP-4-dehydro-6-deoxy-D-mannose reductase
VGNLEAKRDFTDVRDMVRAYVLALENCEPGEVYNICRGRCWSIREVLDMLLARTKTKIEVREDPARLRPSDVQILLGDNSRFVAGHRLAAGDPVRADARGHAGLLALALTRPGWPA